MHSKLKDYILFNYDQSELFARYFNLPISVITKAIETRKNICNPHRFEDDPSLNFRFKDGRLRIFDYGHSGYRGDIFDFVGFLLNKNPSVAYEFIEICNDIISQRPFNKVELYPDSVSNDSIISYYSRQFNNFDSRYWNDAGVSKKHLNNRGVLVAKSAQYNNLDFYHNIADDPLFVYILGYDKDLELIKTYRPYGDKSNKFRTNNTFLFEGIHELYPSKILIISKSRKDKLVIESHLQDGDIAKQVAKLVNKMNTSNLSEYPFTHGFYNPDYKIKSDFCVTNFLSESVLLTANIIKVLQNQHDTIIINYDYDLTGIFSAFFYYKVYGFYPVFIGRDENIVLDKLTDRHIGMMLNKLSEFDIMIEDDEIVNFIKEHSDANVGKDWYELAILNINKTNNQINETFNRFL
jgi:hypothetical protein